LQIELKEKIKNLNNIIKIRKLQLAFALIIFVSAAMFATGILTNLIKSPQEKQEPAPSVSIGCDRVLWNDVKLELAASIQNINKPYFNWSIDGKYAGDIQKINQKLEVGDHQIVLNVTFDNKTLTAKQTTVVIDSVDGISIRNSAASKNQWGFQTVYKGINFGVNEMTVTVDSLPPAQVNDCGFISSSPLPAGDYTWTAMYQGKIIASGTFNLKEVSEIKIARIEVAPSYNAGDTVNGKIVIKNTGSAVVKSFDIKTLVVNNNYAWMGDKARREYLDQYNSDIKPGEIYEVPITVTIPEKVSGIRPSGRYSITVSLIFNGQMMDTKIVNTEVK
jgi:hypothetical protein